MLAFENASVLHWWNGFRAAALLQPEIEAKLVDRLSGVALYMSRSLFEDSRAVCGTRGLDGLVERQLHARRECAHLRVTGMGIVVRSSFDPVAADVVGSVHGLVGAWIRAPAAREGAVLAPRAGKGRVQLTVRDGDRHVVAPDVPSVWQRHGRRSEERRVGKGRR